MYRNTAIDKKIYTELISLMKEEKKQYDDYAMHSLDFRIKQALCEIYNYQIARCGY